MSCKVKLRSKNITPLKIHFRSNGYLPSETLGRTIRALMDIEGRRIDEMDQNGVEMMILSLNAQPCRRFTIVIAPTRSRKNPMTCWPSGCSAIRAGSGVRRLTASGCRHGMR